MVVWWLFGGVLASSPPARSSRLSGRELSHPGRPSVEHTRRQGSHKLHNDAPPRHLLPCAVNSFTQMGWGAQRYGSVTIAAHERRQSCILCMHAHAHRRVPCACMRCPARFTLSYFLLKGETRQCSVVPVCGSMQTLVWCARCRHAMRSAMPIVHGARCTPAPDREQYIYQCRSLQVCGVSASSLFMISFLAVALASCYPLLCRV